MKECLLPNKEKDTEKEIVRGLEIKRITYILMNGNMKKSY